MIFGKLFGKKKERVNNPYNNCPYFVIDKKVQHQNIGGKKGYSPLEVAVTEIMYMAEDGNWAACNFIDRRNDIFELKMDPMDVRPHSDHIIFSGPKDMEFWYVKVYTNPDHLGGAYAWLGYFVASDEIDNLSKQCVECAKKEQEKWEMDWCKKDVEVTKKAAEEMKKTCMK